MPLPPLHDWDATAARLHLTTQVIAALRVAALAPQPNFLHLSTAIRPDGLTTGMLPVGEVRADFTAAAVVYQPPQGDPVSFALADHTQVTLTAALLDATAAHGYTLTVAQNESGHEAPLHDTTPLTIDLQQGTNYAQALYRIFTATARFRARLFAAMTPIVAWPEHFDLSFLVFASPQTSEEYPHMNFGFAPFSDGITRPYLYAYAYPLPASGYTGVTLPPQVQLDTPGFGGPLVWYDDFAALDDPEAFVEATFLAIHQGLLPLLTP